MNEAMRHQANLNTYTENGQMAYSGTGNPVLDLFSTIGALRSSNPERIKSMVENAYNYNPTLTMKTLFFARDIRQGLGEREVFRIAINHLANGNMKMVDSVRKNIEQIPTFGRFDDLFCLDGSYVSTETYDFIKYQLNKDIENMRHNLPVSLLAKWLPTADASSKTTRRKGIKMAFKLFDYPLSPVYQYKRAVKSLRKYIDITERKMSRREWDQINYNHVPGRAMMIYRNAFMKHDGDRFNRYINDSRTKMKTDTLYPFDIVHRYINDTFRGIKKLDPVLEKQWESMPNYVGDAGNTIVMADTSGSMYVNGKRPIEVAVSLAIYFAERNTGPFKNMWMSFSEDAKVQLIKDHEKTLKDKLKGIDYSTWGMNTDLAKALRNILHIAQAFNVDKADMIKNLIIISDMEIDACCDTSFLYQMNYEYDKAGYDLPNIVFWNVNSRNSTFLATRDSHGVQLISGSSPKVFTGLMQTISVTPEEFMMETLNSERYSTIFA